jgi:hypothetical protein
MGRLQWMRGASNANGRGISHANEDQPSTSYSFARGGGRHGVRGRGVDHPGGGRGRGRGRHSHGQSRTWVNPNLASAAVKEHIAIQAPAQTYQKQKPNKLQLVTTKPELPLKSAPPAPRPVKPPKPPMPKEPSALVRTKLVRIHGRMYSLLKTPAPPPRPRPRPRPASKQASAHVGTTWKTNLEKYQKGSKLQAVVKKQWVRCNQSFTPQPRSKLLLSRLGPSSIPRPPSHSSSKKVVHASMLRARALTRVRGLYTLSAKTCQASVKPKTLPLLSRTQMKRRAVWSKQLAEAVGPCLAFCRTGQCEGKLNGLCKREHDPSKVTVCPKLLSVGSCPGSFVEGQIPAGGVKRCHLQHKVVNHLLPLCSFFEREASCSNPLCPYPHIRHGAETPVCEDFARGFCPLGTFNCPNRHVLASGDKGKKTKKRKASSSATGKEKGTEGHTRDEMLIAERLEKRQRITWRIPTKS